MAEPRQAPQSVARGRRDAVGSRAARGVLREARGYGLGLGSRPARQLGALRNTLQPRPARRGAQHRRHLILAKTRHLVQQQPGVSGVESRAGARVSEERAG